MLAEPPSNGEYLAAAYVVASIILLGYWFRLWRLAKKTVNRNSASVSREREGRP